MLGSQLLDASQPFALLKRHKASTPQGIAVPRDPAPLHLVLSIVWPRASRILSVDSDRLRSKARGRRHIPTLHRAPQTTDNRPQTIYHAHNHNYYSRIAPSRQYHLAPSQPHTARPSVLHENLFHVRREHDLTALALNAPDQCVHEGFRATFRVIQYHPLRKTTNATTSPQGIRYKIERDTSPCPPSSERTRAKVPARLVSNGLVRQRSDEVSLDGEIPNDSGKDATDPTAAYGMSKYMAPSAGGIHGMEQSTTFSLPCYEPSGSLLPRKHE